MGEEGGVIAGSQSFKLQSLTAVRDAGEHAGTRRRLEIGLWRGSEF